MTTTIDDRARRLVAAVGAAASPVLRVPTPGSRILTDLYSRVRERLGQLAATGSKEDAAEDLALTVYLCWLAEEDAPGPDVLVALKTCIERVLKDEGAVQG